MSYKDVIIGILNNELLGEEHFQLDTLLFIAKQNHNCRISSVWACEVLRTSGYKYDRSMGYWYYDKNSTTENSTTDQYKILQEQYIKKLEEINKLKIKLKTQKEEYDKSLSKIVSRMKALYESYRKHSPVPKPDSNDPIKIQEYKNEDFKKFPAHQLAYRITKILEKVDNNVFCRECKNILKCERVRKLAPKSCNTLEEMFFQIYEALEVYTEREGLDWIID